jgi:acyl-coenzyme A thioesterase PaaI-like protein
VAGDPTDSRRLPPHHPHCLGCGPDNPGTLGLRLAIEGERVRGHCTLDDRHQGAPGFAHGGAVATALDDTLGTLLMVLGQPGVTVRLEVNYRRPAFLGRSFELEAWVEREDGRKIHMGAEMRDHGEVVADAAAMFLQVEPDHFLRSGEVPEEWTNRWWREGRRLPY